MLWKIYRNATNATTGMPEKSAYCAKYFSVLCDLYLVVIYGELRGKMR